MLRLAADDPLALSLFKPTELKGLKKLQRVKRGRRAGNLTDEQEMDLRFEALGLQTHGYTRQFKFGTSLLSPTGRPRQWAFDFAWREAMLAVEYEGLVMRKGADGNWQMGGGHGTITGFREDCQKYNAASLLGWTVLRYERGMVRANEPYEDVAKFLKRFDRQREGLR